MQVFGFEYNSRFKLACISQVLEAWVSLFSYPAFQQNGGPPGLLQTQLKSIAGY
jgi:hypothetical protein